MTFGALAWSLLNTRVSPPGTSLRRVAATMRMSPSLLISVLLTSVLASRSILLPASIVPWLSSVPLARADRLRPA
ncbi:hypothetical protein D3C84_1234390 [compost metagenome]